MGIISLTIEAPIRMILRLKNGLSGGGSGNRERKMKHNNQPHHPNSRRDYIGRHGCGVAGLGGFIGFHTLCYPHKNVYAGHIRWVEYQALGRPAEANQPKNNNTTIN